jgi:hypothetical protein
MPANPFPQWLPEVAAAAVIVDPGDIAAEALGNQWSKTRPPAPGEAETEAEPSPPDLPVWSLRLP